MPEPTYITLNLANAFNSTPPIKALLAKIFLVQVLLILVHLI